MPCLPFKYGQTTGMICGGRGGRRKKCFYCGNDADILCDFPVKKQKNGKWKTCDRNLCEKCTRKGVSPEVDFCRQHYPPAKAAYERRKASEKL